MGCPSLAFKVIVACHFFLFMIFQSHCTVTGSSMAVSEKVDISVYYEVLNRTCASFIVRSIAQIFNNRLIDIVNLRLVPLQENATLCQSNSDECQLNILQACTINAFPDVNKHFALIYCFEFLVVERRSKEWNSCFSSLGLPPKPVLDCFNSITGTQLVQGYASEIAQLQPPHTFVPWVVINTNQSIGSDYRNFTAYACKAYNGTSLPMVCQNHP